MREYTHGLLQYDCCRVLFTSVVDMAGCLLVDASYMAEQVNQVDENSRRQALPMLKRVKVCTTHAETCQGMPAQCIPRSVQCMYIMTYSLREWHACTGLVQ